MMRFLAFAAILCLPGTFTRAEDPKPTTLKGQLPKNFKALGLTADQVQQIYKIMADAKAKLADLEAQKKADEVHCLALKTVVDVDAVLTDAQRGQLSILRGREFELRTREALRSKVPYVPADYDYLTGKIPIDPLTGHVIDAGRVDCGP